MINRQNYLDVHVFLHHMARRQLDPATIKRARSHLRHLLEWADETPLTKARSIDPVFPAYLATAHIVQPFAKKQSSATGLAPASITKCLAQSRSFFEFAHSEWILRYKSITPSWIELLQPPRGLRAESRLVVRQYWTLADVQTIASVSVKTLREARGQVAVCMLYLSGMRAEALASLPIHCVNLAAGAIQQIPEAGVKTKNRKAAVTYLLPIPEIHAVVARWDERVRTAFPPPNSRSLPLMKSQEGGSLWYANLSSDGMNLINTSHAREARHTTIEDDVRIICARAGIPYLSPHKLRHGHVVYALHQIHTIAELKAVSQNIMHASAAITDQVYGKLVNDEVKNIIASLGAKTETSDDISELIRLLKLKLSPPSSPR